jgi:D-alanine-D-alanine ligase
MKAKIKLAILTGGPSAEKEVSLKSAQVVMNNVDTNKYEAYLVDISSIPWQSKGKDGVLADVDLNTFGIKGKEAFDFAFLAIHGTPAEDGKLQGYFDLLNIPYSACSVVASAITFDKDITKQLLQNINIPMANSVLLTKWNYSLDKINADLSYPVFVKPNKNGSSYGVSKVKQEAELAVAIEQAFQFDDEVLVEEFIEGRELACGIMEDQGDLVCFPITEISTENEFFDYEAKYLGKSSEVTPAPISDEQRDRCFDWTKKIYKHLKLSGVARVDYFLKGDTFYLLEVNTIPGLSAASLLPQQAVAHGFSLTHFFDSIITNEMGNTNNLSR